MAPALAAPPESASAAASASASAISPANAPPPVEEGPPGDGSQLLTYKTYLIVRSSADAEVFVLGKNVGRTNQKLEVHCRQRHIRLRDPESLRWLTAGEGVRLPCQTVHTVTIEPDS